MQNALYFENSHVRPVPLLIGVKKKFPQQIITKKISCTAFTLEKKYLLCWSVGKKSFQGEIFQPPLLKWFAPKQKSPFTVPASLSRVLIT